MCKKSHCLKILEVLV